MALANNRAKSDLLEKEKLIRHLEQLLQEKAKTCEDLGSKIIHLQDKNLSLRENQAGIEKELFTATESFSKVEKEYQDLNHRFEDSQIQIKILEKEIKQLKYQMEDTDYNYDMKF